MITDYCDETQRRTAGRARRGASTGYLEGRTIPPPHTPTPRAVPHTSAPRRHRHAPACVRVAVPVGRLDAGPVHGPVLPRTRTDTAVNAHTYKS